MGRAVRVGAGVGRRRVDLARPRRRAHVAHPPRHAADPAVAAPAVRSWPARWPPSTGCRTAGHPVRRPRRRSTAASRRSARSADRRTRAELIDECLDIVTGLWAGQPFSYSGTHYQVAADDVPDDRPHRAAAARADLVRRRARTGRSRWPGRCAGTACCRRCSTTASAEQPTLEEIADVRRRASATGPTTSSSRARARSTPRPPGPTPARRGGSSRCGTRSGRPTRCSPPSTASARARRVIELGRRRRSSVATSQRLELRRPVGGARRAPARRAGPAPRPGGRRRGPSSTGAPTASPPRSSTPASPSRTRSPSTCTTRPSTSSRRSARSRPGWRPSTPTTGTPPTSSSTCGTTPTSSPSSSTARSAERIDELRHRAARASARGCGSTTAPARAPTGRRRTRTPRRRPRTRPTVAPWGRSGDHLCCSTPAARPGMPKGVMWRQDDLFGALDAANRKRLPPEPDLDAARDRVTKPGPRNLPAAPLMHGTGLFNALSNLMVGGSVVTMEGRHFDPVELLDTIEQRAHQLDVDRRRRLRQADPAGPRRRARPVGHLLAARDRLQRGDVVGGDQGRAAAPQRAADHGRRARLAARRSAWRRARSTADDAAQTATFQLGPEHARRHRRRARRRRGAPASWAGWRCAATRRSATTRTPRSRRPRSRSSTACATRSPATSPGRRRRHRAPARPRQPVHQHRRREGLPRGGRGGAQAAPDGRRRRRGRRARRALRRGDHGARRAARRATSSTRPS